MPKDGRPRIQDENKKKRSLSISLTPEEIGRLQSLKEKRGLKSLSQVIVQLLAANID